MICTNCGTVQHGDKRLPGSGWIELILWLCYIVPGVIYSIWRRGAKRAVCASCGSPALVDTLTPVGQRLAATLHPGGLPPPPPRQYAQIPPALLGKPNWLHWMGLGILLVVFLGVISR